MKPQRIVALVIGCVLLLPGIGILIGAGVLGSAWTFGRNDEGYFERTMPELTSSTAAITATGPVLSSDIDTRDWLNSLNIDVRLRVTPANPESPLFVGIGPATAVAAYLSGTAHDEITELANDGRSPVYRTIAGEPFAEPPQAQGFWVATGNRELNWRATDGSWAVVVMNADGSPGIRGAATVEVRAPFVPTLAVILVAVGVVLTALAVVLIIVGASGRRDGVGYPVEPADARALERASVATLDYPVVLTARIDLALSRWQWLVKWLLAVPHLIILAFLWVAFFVVTVVAGFSILFTGTYPRSLFEFNRGVLQWSWRVSFYAFTGGMGTDQYPPFTLGPAPDYPARLDIAYPPRLSRGLVLVKWWLLAIPHFLILGLLTSNWWGWTDWNGNRFEPAPAGNGGILGLLVLIAVVILLFTGKYPKSLFDLVVGLNRWIFRVIAYVALMTDQYPPFRLDQGGSEPVPTPTPTPLGGPIGSPQSVDSMH